jgi:hypothetical protein
MHNYDVLAIFKYLNGTLPMHVAILIVIGKTDIKIASLD